jgi:alpha-beta hydrolase superfamily lysophospholipase
MSRDLVLVHGASEIGEHLAELRRHFEQRGWTVHTPTLRHHAESMPEQAKLVAGVSLRDYVADLTELACGFDSPLIGGFSLGGLIAQLVAARTPHRGLFCLAPSAAPGMRAPLASLRVLGGHFLHPTPWRKPVRPMSWEMWRGYVANAHDEAWARDTYNSHLRCESGRVYWELGFFFLDHHRAARIDYQAVTAPVLVTGGTQDRMIGIDVPRQTAARYANGKYVAVEGADHMQIFGPSLFTVLRHIDQWIDENNLASEPDRTRS